MESLRKQHPINLVTEVLKTLCETVPPGSSLCVGVSGGLDSMALLHVLAPLSAQFPFSLSAVHINHQLHPEAAQWQQLVEATCRAWQIPCSAHAVTVNRKDPDGLEAAARRARYAVFGAMDADFIVLAHHQDDQAETLLTQLLRGAGLPGLSAMPTDRPFAALQARPQLLRPLLNCSHRTLTAYAQSHDLRWVDDSSNQDTVHVRNYLRHALSPILDLRFPAWRTTLARSAHHFADAQMLLNERAEEDFAACGQKEGLRVAELLALGPRRAANLLRWWLRGQGAPACHSEQLSQWLKQSAAPADRKPELAWGGWALNRFDGLWQLRRTLDKHWAPLEIEHWPTQALIIPEAGVLHQSVVQGQGIQQAVLQAGGIRVQRRQGGERLRPHAERPSRSLRNLLQEAHLPPWYRAALPLVFQGDTLICVPGVAVEASFQAREGEAGLELHWQPPHGASPQV
jgi:tRNA(Ile)-lysidine synthase